MLQALTTQSGAFHEQPYSFKTRFQSEDGRAGTNPEELLAAAHARCYAMALSFALSNAGHPPAEQNVTAAVDLAKEATPHIGFVSRGLYERFYQDMVSNILHWLKGQA
jgi:OsmC subfamily peroxiredoxin